MYMCVYPVTRVTCVGADRCVCTLVSLRVSGKLLCWRAEQSGAVHVQMSVG